MMKIIAPGKIILSGEHSVVYGSPAFAVSVNKHTHLKISNNDQEVILLELSNLNIKYKRTVKALKQLHQQMDSDFSQRMNNNPDQTEPLLPDSGAMYFYAISHFFHDYGIEQANLTITINSDIPIGSGMGSSASTLSALYLALYEYFSIPFDQQLLALQVAHAERFQHACISRIDSNVTVLGGFIKFNNNTISKIDITLDNNWWLIYTGMPESSTGECVASVRKRYSMSSIWSEFKAVTDSFEQALHISSAKQTHAAVQGCHRLLNTIGVVPQKINWFIQKLEDTGLISAKISGAGSVKGEKAGLLLAYVNDSNEARSYFKQLCHEQRYTMHPLVIDSRGVRLCD